MTIEKRQRRSFPEDFKREAVALITEQGYKVSEAARSLDIHENVLRKWKRRFEQEAGGEIPTADEREELRRLRRENRELRMEKEILKKASAYFARQMK
jgi:transposase